MINKISSETTEFRVKDGDSYKSIELSKNAVEDNFTGSYRSSGGLHSFFGFTISGDSEGTKLFEFLAANTNVEWSQAKTGENENGSNFITTSNLHGEEGGMTQLIIDKFIYGYDVRELIHSHPENTGPSDSDYDNASRYGFLLDSLPQYKVFLPGVSKSKEKNNYITYTPILQPELIITPH